MDRGQTGMTSFRGSLALYMREELEKVKADEREKFAKDLLTYSGGEVKMTSVNFGNEKEYKHPFTISLVNSVDNLVTLTPDEVLFHAGGLFAPAMIKDMAIDAEERLNPIKIHFDEEYTKTIDLHYPQRWSLRTELVPGAIENSFGSLNVKYDNAPGTLTVTQHRLLKRSSEPKEKIADLALLAGSKSKVALPTVVFGITK